MSESWVSGRKVLLVFSTSRLLCARLQGFRFSKLIPGSSRTFLASWKGGAEVHSGPLLWELSQEETPMRKFRVYRV